MKIKLLLNSTAIFSVFLFVFSVPAIAADNSGFMGDYSGLQPDPDRPGAMRYIKTDADISKYNKIAMTPIEIWYDPASEYKGISPDDLKHIADNMRGVIVKELEPDYPVVDTAGPDVLAARMAIANVKISKKKRNLLNFTPAGFALYTLKDIAGANVNLADAVIEVEMLDSTTGEQLGMLVDRLSASGEQITWQKLEEALVFYARRFRSHLDAEHKN
jgi:hypothetical protein